MPFSEQSSAALFSCSSRFCNWKSKLSMPEPYRRPARFACTSARRRVRLKDRRVSIPTILYFGIAGGSDPAERERAAHLPVVGGQPVYPSLEGAHESHGYRDNDHRRKRFVPAPPPKSRHTSPRDRVSTVAANTAHAGGVYMCADTTRGGGLVSGVCGANAYGMFLTTPNTCACSCVLHGVCHSDPAHRSNRLI